MKVIAITQARVGSTRLPGKILKRINGKTLLELHLERLQGARSVDQVMVATTVRDEDDEIVKMTAPLSLSTYRGSVNDVLDRFYQAVKNEHPDYVVRVTSDCPLLDPSLVDKIIAHTIAKKLDYCSNTLDARYPDGQDVEVMTFTALAAAWRDAKLDSEREHVTPYIWKNSSFKGGTRFTSENFSDTERSYGHIRMTVDEQADFDVITKVVDDLGPDKGWLEYAEYLESNLDVRKLNDSIGRNEGYTKSLNKDQTAL